MRWIARENSVSGIGERGELDLVHAARFGPLHHGRLVDVQEAGHVGERRIAR